MLLPLLDFQHLHSFDSSVVDPRMSVRDDGALVWPVQATVPNLVAQLDLFPNLDRDQEAAVAADGRDDLNDQLERS